MRRRSPARFLAPIALLAAFATIYLVVHAGLKTTSGASTATGTTASARKAGSSKTTAKSTKSKRKASAKRYTVKSGDVLGVIATRTGVAVDDLLRYNRLDAAQPLRVGQKLKLAP